MVALDPILEVFLLLKNNWSLTGDLAGNAITWSTGYYDAAVETPQIVVRQVEGDSTPPLTMGASGAFYQDLDVISIGLWVRPKQDNNTSIGWAKNAIYQFRKEVERICRSGSNLGTDSNGYQRLLFLGSWAGDYITQRKPVCYHQTCLAKIIKTVKGV